MVDAIILESVSKIVGIRQVLQNVSFIVEQGDIFGYLGPNGAGKTTSIRILLGLLTATSGKAAIMGRDVRIDNVRQRVGFVLDSDGLYDNMTAYENIRYYSQIYGMSYPYDRIKETLKLVNLTERARDKVSTYSRGMRQRLALARAMVHDPDVLILDEPTSGVDPTGQIEIRQIMLELTQQEGKTIFLSSHNLDEVQRICNRIALIDEGQIKLYGDLHDLQKDMRHGEVVIETSEPITDMQLAELNTLSGLHIQNIDGNILSLSVVEAIGVPDIINLLVQQGVRIEQVKRRDASLEEMYTAILKKVEQ